MTRWRSSPCPWRDRRRCVGLRVVAFLCVREPLCSETRLHREAPSVSCGRSLDFYSSFVSISRSVCPLWSVLILASGQPDSTRTYTHAHTLSILAFSSNKTTTVQPLARRPRWTDHSDVRLDTHICTGTHTHTYTHKDGGIVVWIMSVILSVWCHIGFHTAVC